MLYWAIITNYLPHAIIQQYILVSPTPAKFDLPSCSTPGGPNFTLGPPENMYISVETVSYRAVHWCSLIQMHFIATVLYSLYKYWLIFYVFIIQSSR